MSFTLQTKLNKLVGKEGGDDDTPSKKKKNDSANMLLSMMEQCAEMEKDGGDLDQANFSGMMGVFMQKLLKPKKDWGGTYLLFFCCPALCKPSSNFQLHFSESHNLLANNFPSYYAPAYSDDFQVDEMLVAARMLSLSIIGHENPHWSIQGRPDWYQIFHDQADLVTL